MRFLSMLTALAVMLAPLGMFGGGPATAQAAPASADHCRDMQKPSNDGTSSKTSCCVAACAGMPAMQSGFAEDIPLPAPLRFAFVAAAGSGLVPEAETPPPRTA